MVWQAFIDDSGSEPQSPIFVLGGLVADHTAWARFSDAWQAALDLTPKLEYFKMSEAGAMREQFSPSRYGWTETLRDDRVVTLAHIIRAHATARICAWIRHDDYETHIASLPTPVRRLMHDSPYFILFMQTILATAIFGAGAGISEPCDYIFDEQAKFSEEMLAWWPNFKLIVEHSSKSDLPSLIGSPPIFRNEKQFLPLQGADLVAWQMRNDYVRNNRVPNQTIVVPPTTAMRIIGELPMIHRPYHTAEVIRLREFLLGVGKQYAEQFPDIPLLPPITDKRARQKAHRDARKATPKPPSSEEQSS
jgi:hypothetical protein